MSIRRGVLLSTICLACATSGCRKRAAPPPTVPVPPATAAANAPAPPPTVPVPPATAAANAPAPAEPLRQAGAYVVELYYLAPPRDEDWQAFTRLGRATGFRLVDNRDDKHSDPGGEDATVVFTRPSIEEAPPPWPEHLARSGHGLLGNDAERVKRAVAVTELAFDYPAVDVHARLREADQLVYAIARDTGAFVLDNITKDLFTASAWRDQRVGAWSDAAIVASRHISLGTHGRGGHRVATTIGMRALGLPDVSVSGFDEESAPRVAGLLRSTADALEVGGGLAADGTLTLELLPCATQRTVRVRLAPAQAEQGEGERALLEIVLGDPPPHHASLAQLERLAPPHDRLEAVRDDDPVVKAAVAAVQARLPSLRARFEQGLPRGQQLRVKAPFRAGPHDREDLWLEVLSWKGETLRGRILERPELVEQLSFGQRVDVPQAELEDYQLVAGSGRRDEGPFLDAIIDRQAVAHRP